MAETAAGETAAGETAAGETAAEMAAEMAVVIEALGWGGSPGVEGGSPGVEGGSLGVEVDHALMRTAMRWTARREFRQLVMLGHNALHACDQAELLTLHPAPTEGAGSAAGRAAGGVSAGASAGASGGAAVGPAASVPHHASVPRHASVPHHASRVGQVWLMAPLALRLFGRSTARRFISELGEMKAAELDALASYVEARISLPLHSLGAQLLALSDADGTWSDMARRLSEMLWGLAGVAVLGGGMRL